MNYFSVALRLIVVGLCCMWMGNSVVASPLQIDSLAGKVSLTLTAEKEAYVEGEDIRLGVTVKNVSDTAVYVFNPSELGSVVLYISDMKGREIPGDMEDVHPRRIIRLSAGRVWKGVLGLIMYSNDSEGTLRGGLTKILEGEYQIHATMKDVSSNEICIKINKQSLQQQKELATIQSVFGLKTDEAVKRGIALLTEYKNSAYLPTIYSRLINVMHWANREHNLNDELIRYCEEFIERFPRSFVPISKLDYYMQGIELKNGVSDGQLLSQFDWNNFKFALDGIKEKFRGGSVGIYIDQFILENGFDEARGERYKTAPSAGGTNMRVYVEPKQGMIVGYVTEARTGEPLEGVNVLVVGTTLNGVTDERGWYCIKKVPLGNFTIRANGLNYLPQLQQVQCLSGEISALNFEMLTYDDAEEERARKDIREGNVHLRWLGFEITTGISEEEVLKITKKYGFVHDGGLGSCVRTGSEHIYSKIVTEYLDRRNGKGWRKRMEREFENRNRQLIKDWE